MLIQDNISTVLFISTNSLWGGSEIVWIRYATELNKQNFNVHAAAKYDHAAFGFLKNKFLNYHAPVQHSFSLRLLNKLRIKKIRHLNLLREFILQLKPALVIVSQGDNAGSLDVMQYCSANQIKFITITHLVSESFFPIFKNENLPVYRAAYLAASRNFFVSRHNLRLTEYMLGIGLPNATTMLNPCTVQGEAPVPYPTAETYKIALVGRLECFQKGYDILLKVLANEKWQTRNIHFNIYGNGQHLLLLRSNIERFNIKNVFLHLHTENIREVWRQNHLLCMPSRAEGQSLALIEAMYFSRAAIVTDVGGAIELITDKVNGFIAAPSSVKNLDEALENAWEKRGEWEAMGKAARHCIMEKYQTPAEVLFCSQVQQLLQ